MGEKHVSQENTVAGESSVDKENRVLRENRLKKTWVVCLLAAVSCFLWGSAFPGIKIGYAWFLIAAGDSASQIVFAGMRFLIAGILVILFGSITSRAFLKPKNALEWKHACIISIFQTILQYLFFYTGLAHTAGTKASIIVGSNVFIAILVTCFVFKQEKISRFKIYGCILGFIGVVLINITPDGMALNMSFHGEGYILISTIAYAVSSSLMKSYSKTDNPMMLSGYQFLIGGGFMMLMGHFMGGSVEIPDARDTVILGYLAFSSAAAYTIWCQLLKYNPVSKIAVFCFMTPMFGVILSALLLNEAGQISFLQGVLALICITIGIVISYREF